MTAADYLVNQVKEGLVANDQGQLDRAVSDAIRALGTRLPVDKAEDLADELYNQKRWAPLVRFTDALSALDSSPTIRKYLYQGLVETGARRAAERLAADMLADESVPVRERSELHGLVGRVNKDAWLLEDGGDAALDLALTAYRAGYDLGVDPLWHGVNILALQFQSGRDFDDDLLPDQLLAVAEGGDQHPWSLATQVELRAGFRIGDPLPVVEALLAHEACNPKVISALHRQLADVWKRPGDDPVILKLAAAEFTDPGEVDIVVPAGGATPTDGDYEKYFGADRPVELDLYLTGAERARSVAKVSLQGQGIGTAFVMRGTDLHATLPDGPVLVTNEHVIEMPEPPDGIDAPTHPIAADEVDIEFEFGPGGEPVHLASARPVWWSHRTDLDVCVLVTDDPAIAQFPTVPVARRTPRPRPGVYVYVIGHPLGGELSVSIRGNDLTGGDKVRLHYTAPTERGSSGSPVFDADWELVAVHHMGKKDLPTVDGRGVHQANEGMTIEAIQKQMAERPPDLGAGG
ncbi:MAG: serine protease [Actinomycetota bacterium]